MQTFNDKGGKGRRLGRRLSEQQAERSTHEHLGQTSRTSWRPKKFAVWSCETEFGKTKRT